MQASSLPPRLIETGVDERVEAILEPGETLLWADRPRVGRFVLAALPRTLVGLPMAFLIPPWTAIAWRMLTEGAQAELEPWEKLVGFLYPAFIFPVTLIVLGLILAPWFAWRHQARKTTYALTDRRALVWHAGRYGGLESAEIRYEDLEVVEILRSRTTGEGDLDLLSKPILLADDSIPEPAEQGGEPESETRAFHYLGIDFVAEVAALAERSRQSACSHDEQSDQLGQSS